MRTECNGTRSFTWLHTYSGKEILPIPVNQGDHADLDVANVGGDSYDGIENDINIAVEKIVRIESG